MQPFFESIEIRNILQLAPVNLNNIYYRLSANVFFDLLGTRLTVMMDSSRILFLWALGLSLAANRTAVDVPLKVLFLASPP